MLWYKVNFNIKNYCWC